MSETQPDRQRRNERNEPSPLGNRISNAVSGVMFNWIGHGVAGLALALGTGSFAWVWSSNSTTVAHEIRIKAIEDDKIEDAKEARSRRIEMDQRLTRIENQLDTLLSRIPQK